MTISVDIMLLRKNKMDNNVLFVDASKEFVKVTKNNRLSDDNITSIVGVVASREEKQHFSHIASYDEITSNNYNLSVATYVEAEDNREKIDIRELNNEIEAIVAREDILRKEIAAIISEIDNLD